MVSDTIFNDKNLIMSAINKLNSIAIVKEIYGLESLHVNDVFKIKALKRTATRFGERILVEL